MAAVGGPALPRWSGPTRWLALAGLWRPTAGSATDDAVLELRPAAAARHRQGSESCAPGARPAPSVALAATRTGAVASSHVCGRRCCWLREEVSGSHAHHARQPRQRHLPAGRAPRLAHPVCADAADSDDNRVQKRERGPADVTVSGCPAGEAEGSEQEKQQRNGAHERESATVHARSISPGSRTPLGRFAANGTYLLGRSSARHALKQQAGTTTTRHNAPATRTEPLCGVAKSSTANATRPTATRRKVHQGKKPERRLCCTRAT